MKRTEMTDVKDILRHRHDLELTRDEIAAVLGVSAGTVTNVLQRASATGLACWPLPDDLDDEALRDRLYPHKERDHTHVQPDWDALIAEFTAPRGWRLSRLTRRHLWLEYREEAVAQGSAAHSHSQFCALFKAHLKDHAMTARMHFDHTPGLIGLLDFSGKTLALQVGTGMVEVEIFVATLAFSKLIYAEAAPDQKIRHWTMAHRRTLEYFGGCPRRWVIDDVPGNIIDHPAVFDFTIEGRFFAPKRTHRPVVGRSREVGELKRKGDEW